MSRGEKAAEKPSNHSSSEKVFSVFDESCRGEMKSHVRFSNNNKPTKIRLFCSTKFYFRLMNVQLYDSQRRWQKKSEKWSLSLFVDVYTLNWLIILSSHSQSYEENSDDFKRGKLFIKLLCNHRRHRILFLSTVHSICANIHFHV